MFPHDICTNVEIPVLKMLRNKHPDTRIPDLNHPDNLAIKEYERVPKLVPIQCDVYKVENIA